MEQKQAVDFDEKIMEILLSIGISANLNGYHFLKDSIKMVIDDPTYLSSITKKMYPAVADRWSTTTSKVERSIRHALTVSYNKGKMIYLNNLFGVDILDINDRPTNAEFVALLADRLSLEYVK